MSLWLDGGFWGPWIRKVFVSEIEWMRRAVFEHMLPSFPDPTVEAENVQNDAWEAAMSQVSDGWDDPSAYAEWAEEKGLETYLSIIKMRQAAANLSAAMLWHLLEQQMLVFHMRQVLPVYEEREVRIDPKSRNTLFRLNLFHERLDEGGCSMKSLPSWPKIEELTLVANAVKHGPGKSLDELVKMRPDLLDLPGAETSLATYSRNPARVEKPAGGEDIYVTDADLAAYFDAAIQLWQEFSVAIEAHTAQTRASKGA